MKASRQALEALEALEDAVQGLRDARAFVDELARQAHESGCTWDEIGGALGISKQGAHKRFAGALEEVAR